MKFTQAEVDRIIGERLARDRKDRDSESATIVKLTKEIADSRVSHLKDKIFSEAHLPEALWSFVTGDSEKTIREQVSILVQGIGPGPNVGGSSSPVGGNASPKVYSKGELEKMSPEDINKDWTNIQKQMASGLIK